MPDDSSVRDTSVHTTRVRTSTPPLPRPVVVQPDPMLNTGHAGWVRVALSGVGAAVVVIMVLFGLSRPPEPQQMAAATPPVQASGAAQPAKGTSGQATTTGQGSPGQASDAQAKSAPAQGKAQRSDSNTKTNAKPSDAPQSPPAAKP